MQFKLNERMVKITSVAPNRELHGENPKPVCYITAKVNLMGDELAMFAPALRGAIYEKPEPGKGDLAQQGEDGGTAIRFPHMKLPLVWDDECVGADITFHYGIKDDTHIKLPGAVLDGFKLEPMDGGTCITTFKITCHPDERGMGKLGLMVGTEIQITVVPPAEDVQE